MKQGDLAEARRALVGHARRNPYEPLLDLRCHILRLWELMQHRIEKATTCKKSKPFGMPPKFRNVGWIVEPALWERRGEYYSLANATLIHIRQGDINGMSELPLGPAYRVPVDVNPSNRLRLDRR